MASSICSLFSKSAGSVPSRNMMQDLMSPFIRETSLVSICSSSNHLPLQVVSRMLAKRLAPSSALTGPNVYILHLDFIAGLSFSKSLHVRMSMAFLLYFSMICLIASCAAGVRPSASSSKTTFLSTPIAFALIANFNSLRMKSIPLSSLAFVSMKFMVLKCSPSISLATT